MGPLNLISNKFKNKNHLKKNKNVSPHFEQNVLEHKTETDEFYNIENSLKTIVTEKTNSVKNNQNNVKNDEKPKKKDSDSYDAKITDKATPQASPVSSNIKLEKPE